EMRSVENAMEDKSRQLDASAMTARIDQLEQRAMHLRLPNAYDSSVYTMRVHIGLLRSHLGSILSNENIQREGSQFPRRWTRRRARHRREASSASMTSARQRRFSRLTPPSLLPVVSRISMVVITSSIEGCPAAAEGPRFSASAQISLSRVS